MATTARNKPRVPGTFPAQSTAQKNGKSTAIEPVAQSRTTNGVVQPNGTASKPGKSDLSTPMNEETEIEYSVKLALFKPLLNKLAPLVNSEIVEKFCACGQDKRKRLLVYFSNVPPALICGERAKAGHKVPDALKSAPSYMAMFHKLTAFNVVPPTVFDAASRKQNVEACSTILLEFMTPIMEKLVALLAKPEAKDLDWDVMTVGEKDTPRAELAYSFLKEWGELSKCYWTPLEAKLNEDINAISQGTDIIPYVRKTIEEIEQSREECRRQCEKTNQEASSGRKRKSQPVTSAKFPYGAARNIPDDRDPYSTDYHNPTSYYSNHDYHHSSYDSYGPPSRQYVDPYPQPVMEPPRNSYYGSTASRRSLLPTPLMPPSASVPPLRTEYQRLAPAAPKHPYYQHPIDPYEPSTSNALHPPIHQPVYPPVGAVAPPQTASLYPTSYSSATSSSTSPLVQDSRQWAQQIHRDIQHMVGLFEERYTRPDGTQFPVMDSSIIKRAVNFDYGSPKEAEAILNALRTTWDEVISSSSYKPVLEEARYASPKTVTQKLISFNGQTYHQRRPKEEIHEGQKAVWSPPGSEFFRIVTVTRVNVHKAVIDFDNDIEVVELKDLYLPGY